MLKLNHIKNIFNPQFTSNVITSGHILTNSKNLLYSTENKNTENDRQQQQEEPIRLNEEQIKEKILVNAMKHVNNLGFTSDALSQGNK